MAKKEKYNIQGPGESVDIIQKFKKVCLVREVVYAIAHGADKRLLDTHIYCGDGVFFGLENKNPFMLLTDFENNPGMANPGETERRLSDLNYFLSPSEAKTLDEKALAGNGAVKISLAGLPLKRGSENASLTVDTDILANGRAAAIDRYKQGVALVDWFFGPEVYGPDGLIPLLNLKFDYFPRIHIPNPYEFMYILKNAKNGSLFGRGVVLETSRRCEVSLDLQHLDFQHPTIAYGELK